MMWLFEMNSFIFGTLILVNLDYFGCQESDVLLICYIRMTLNKHQLCVEVN